MDWIMKNSTDGERRGVKWTMTMTATTMLEDLDFCRWYCPAVTPPPRHAGEDRCHGNNSWKPWLEGQHQEDKGHENERQSPRKRQTEWRWDQGSGWFHLPWFQDVKHRRWGGGDPGSTCKSQSGLRLTQSTWKARNIRLKTKLRIFKSNVISTLLYGSESWKVTKTISNKLNVFQNRCLRRILQIYWPNTITNEELHWRAEIEPISTQVKRRRWRWIGHVLRQQNTALTRIALRWTPDGQRKRGRPKETWRRTVEREMKEKGWTWGRLERVSADRHRWRALVEALCATWSTKRTRDR